MTSPAFTASLQLELASGFWDRLVGLLSRSSLQHNTGLLIVPCSNVHTAFMRFTIDAVFVNDQGVVLKIAKNLKPFRVAICPSARACLELASGGADLFKLQLGQCISPVAAALSAVKSKVQL